MMRDRSHMNRLWRERRRLKLHCILYVIYKYIYKIAHVNNFFYNLQVNIENRIVYKKNKKKQETKKHLNTFKV